MNKADEVVRKAAFGEEIPPAIVKARLRACASCEIEFVPEDDTHVTCPACDAFGIRCGCILGESCPICDAVAAIVYGSDEELQF